MAESSAAAVVAGSSEIQSASRPTPPVLRRLPWPQPTPVDLFVQCPWLVLHQKPLDEWVSRETLHEGDALDPQQDEQEDVRHDHPDGGSSKDSQRQSPLKQRLRARRDPPESLSPAQRAAKKILRLQDEMQRQEDKRARLDASEAAKQLKSASVAPPTAVKATISPLKSNLPVVRKQAKTKTTNTPVEDSPEARLQRWLNKQRPEASDKVEPSEYSTEMETRIHRKMNQTLGEGLWKDEVASLIAAELSSESVFGGFVSTRRLAFDSQTKAPNEATIPAEPPQEFSMKATQTAREAEAQDIEMTAVVNTSTSEVSTRKTTREHTASPVHVSVVEMFADEVRDEARELVAEGQIHDALRSLQAGIDRVLHDFQDNHDEIIAHGFDYSALAHAKAIRLQLTYKARHRRRLASLVILQRVWRRFRARNKFLKERQYRTTNAKVIQLYYKKRFYHRKRESSATRIQRCFRIFQQQKTLIRLHQACRMLNMQERRKRERIQARKALRRRLWSKMKVVLRVIRLFRIRRFSICWLQSHWRGWKARQSYTAVLRAATEAEVARRVDEDAFVRPRLARVMDILSAFYRETAPGRAQVQWAARQPWLHWRRLRSEWENVTRSDRVEALCGIYGPNAIVRGVEMSAVGTLLTGKSTESTPSKRGIPISIDDLHKWLDAAAQKAVTTESTPAGSRHRSHIMEKVMTVLSIARSKAKARVKSFKQSATNARDRLLWNVVFYPRLVVRDSKLTPQRQETARRELLSDQHRVWQALLRHVFRVAENAPPKFVCAWCGEGHATAKAYYSHRNGSGGCVESQRKAVLKKRETQDDVNYHSNRFKIKGRWRRQQAAPRATIPPAPACTNQFDSVRGSRVAKKRHNRAALRRLVDAAQCCEPPGISNPNSLLPSELLTLLLSCLDDTSSHPLVRMQAFAVKDAVWGATGAPPVGWIATQEVERSLGLAPQPTGAPGRLRGSLARLQEAAKRKWRAWRERGGRYRTPTGARAGHPRVLAAV